MFLTDLKFQFNASTLLKSKTIPTQKIRWFEMIWKHKNVQFIDAVSLSHNSVELLGFVTAEPNHIFNTAFHSGLNIVK